VKVNFDLQQSDVKVEQPPKKMLTITKEDGRTHVEINPSSLDILKTCPTKSYYTLEKKYVSNLVSSPLIYGIAMHSAMEIWYMAPPEKRLREVTSKMYDMAFEILADPNVEIDYEHNIYFQMVREFVSQGEALRPLSSTDAKSLEAGIWTLKYYINRYSAEDESLQTYVDDEGPFVERTLEALLYETAGLKITVFGTLDLMLKDLITGALVPTDHKTTSRLDSSFYNRIRPNSQFTSYLWLCRKNGFNTNSFMINGIQSKAIPKTARGTPPEFARQITSRTNDEYETYEKEVVYYTMRHLDMLASGYFPNGPVNACSMYRGCQFLDMCSVSTAMRNNIIQSKYPNQGASSGES
jgi:hypothetical protein